jgi:hypothetical protein
MGEDRIVVSLREISEKFGIGIEGARAKAKRRASKGVWRILPQNHPADPLRIEMPAGEFENVNEGSSRETSSDPHTSPPTPTPQQEDQRQESYDIKALVALLEKLTEQASQTTDRLVLAEKERGEAERRADLAEAARLASQEAAEARVAAIRAELQAIIDRQSQTTREAQDELASWRAQPWWKRLVG